MHYKNFILSLSRCPNWGDLFHVKRKFVQFFVARFPTRRRAFICLSMIINILSNYISSCNTHSQHIDHTDMPLFQKIYCCMTSSHIWIALLSTLSDTTGRRRCKTSPSFALCEYAHGLEFAHITDYTLSGQRQSRTD